MKTTLRSWPCLCAVVMLALAMGYEAHWVLGEVTSISVDRNDNIWVLHVPQSVPEA